MANLLSYHPSAEDMAATQVVTHEDIALRARELWAEQGCPENCDEIIWLEAEAELLAIQQRRYRHPHLQLVDPHNSKPRKETQHA
ncbi:MAG TPA: DUF2934 domain-containing protein [Rariglobus sp.]|jgi:hypothetical protein|nr:DUF2934 domain-containing protein [Rariglobus sp.]